MRLSTDIVGLMSNQGIHSAIEDAKNAGFDGVDFPFNYVYNNIPCPIFSEDYLEYANNLNVFAKSKGIRFSQAHAPIPTYDFNASGEINEKKRLGIIRSIDMCEKMEIPYLVVHPVDCREQGVDEFDFNINLLKSFIPYLEGKKVKLALENVYGGNSKNGIVTTPTDSPDLLYKYAEALDENYFAICLDTGHAKTVGYSPSEFIRKLGKRIKLLHVHDGKKGEDMHTLPYLADIDWNDTVSALKEVDFDGDFSFETFRFDSKLPVECRFDSLKLKHSLGRYFLSKFENKQ